MNFPFRLPWALAETRWAEILTPVINLPPNKGILLQGVKLINGTTVINHKLGRIQQGYIITDQNASANIYKNASFNNLTLSLASNAAVTVSLWMF